MRSSARPLDVREQSLADKVDRRVVMTAQGHKLGKAANLYEK
jgi:hypothetical protein